MKLSQHFLNIDEMSIADQLECISKAIISLSKAITPKEPGYSIEYKAIKEKLTDDNFRWFTISQIKLLLPNGENMSDQKIGFALRDLKIEKKRSKVKISAAKNPTVKNVYHISF